MWECSCKNRSKKRLQLEEKSIDMWESGKAFIHSSFNNTDVVTFLLRT